MKNVWWYVRDEARELALWLLARIPLNTGGRLRALFMRFFLRELGSDVVFQMGLRITNPEKVSIGSRCRFGQGVFITGGGGVRIGNWVSLGPDVKVWSVNHRFDDPDQPFQLQGWNHKAVVIEDDVWLAANVFVMPGVTIGKGAVVSACTVVTKSVPPYALVAGNPGRVVGWRKGPRNTDAETNETPVHARNET